MVTILTWKTFLLYGLDLMSKDDVSASVFFIACNQIRYDASVYGSGMQQVVTAKLLWPTDVDECMRDPSKYREYLESIAGMSNNSLGQLMQMSLCLPCFMFVPDIPRNEVLVDVLQEFLHDVFGIGSIWFDGMLYDDEPNEYKQDDDKVKKSFREHIKHAQKNVAKSRQVSGVMYRDTRLNALNDMSEAEMRKYLKKKFNTDTDGMDATQVYSMMYDLFVEETEGSSSDTFKDTIRDKYKRRKKKKL